MSLKKKFLTSMVIGSAALVSLPQNSQAKDAEKC